MKAFVARLLQDLPRDTTFTLGRFVRVFDSVLTSLLTLDALIDFLAMHRNTLGRVHSEASLTSPDAQNGNPHVIANHYALSYTSRKNKHSRLRCRRRPPPSSSFRV